MTDFLIKSTICLAVFLSVYYLVLEREKMHTFNRFYLLFSIIFSFAVPFIRFEIIKQVPEKSLLVNTETMQSMVIHEETNYLSTLLPWLIYGIITTLLFIRFIRNIAAITTKSKGKTKIKLGNATLVLLEEKVVPHTFLNMIFINASDYFSNNIEPQLYEHEMVHVNQKHTLDVLFIEIIKTVFWFNPIFVFYKKAIQLNHEFLADEKIVTSHYDVSGYQALLLSKSMQNLTFNLVSNLNYLITKKRLLMMTKTTTVQQSLLRKALLIPVASALFFTFCIETVAQEKKQPVKNENTKVIPDSHLESSDIVTSPEEKPSYPGGIAAFYKFVMENFKVPNNVQSGRIIVQFVVEKDGSLTEIKTLRDLGPGTGEEAIRVLKLSPKWIPGKQKNVPVRVLYNLPISIMVQK